MAGGKGLGRKIYAWAVTFPRLQPALESIALKLLCRMGRRKESILLFLKWIPVPVCENWGSLELGMVLLHPWLKHTVLVLVLSTCSQLFSTNSSYQNHPLCTLQSLLWEKVLLSSLHLQDALFSVFLRCKTSLL